MNGRMLSFGVGDVSKCLIGKVYTPTMTVQPNKQFANYRSLALRCAMAERHRWNGETVPGCSSRIVGPSSEVLWLMSMTPSRAIWWNRANFLALKCFKGHCFSAKIELSYLMWTCLNVSFARFGGFCCCCCCSISISSFFNRAGNLLFQLFSP